MKKYTNELVRDSNEAYYKKFTERALLTKDSRLYYQVIGRLRSTETPKPFSVSDLYPSKSPKETAELVADFFTQIAENFIPLEDEDRPPPSEEPRLKVTQSQVDKRLISCKKPCGLLSGDIYPDLLTKLATSLSNVITDVLNASYDQEIWPEVWKTESVLVIPKTARPENLNEVRNISCTPVLSKVMEFFVLERLKEEIGPRPNQYGGITGCGTTHYLLQAWNDILELLDDEELAVTLTSIDFAKVFNTMGHQACVQAVQDHGASVHSTRLVAAFLLKRQMRFKVDNVFFFTEASSRREPPEDIARELHVRYSYGQT